MQIRVSEALTILPALTPAAIPGLFIGCLISNMIGPYGILDMVLGGAATLIAAIASYRLRSKPLLVPLPPIITNGFIIGAMLHYAYSVPVSFPVAVLWVGLGEAIACYGLGLPLLNYLRKRPSILRIGPQ